MATVTPTVSNDLTEGARDSTTKLFTWALTSSNTDGLMMAYNEFADRCWSATGTWGGATLTLQGSNDGTNWWSMSNAAGGSAATATTDKGIQTIETPRYARPNLTTAGAGASVTVILLARRNTPMRT